MNEDGERDRNRDRRSKSRVTTNPPPAWEQDLRPHRPSTSQAGEPSDAQVEAEWAAYERRRAGTDTHAVNQTRARGEEVRPAEPDPADGQGR